MSDITDTSTKAGHADLFLDGQIHAMAGGNPSDYAQEARGQRELVRSSVLPSTGIKDIPWAKVLGPVEDDPMFTHVELPEGWSKKPTDHSMWSAVVDDRGRTRANVFYKAASYDRRAFINLQVPFEIQKDYDADPDLVIVLKDFRYAPTRDAFKATEEGGGELPYRERDPIERRLRAECVAHRETLCADPDDQSAWDVSG